MRESAGFTGAGGETVVRVHHRGMHPMPGLNDPSSRRDDVEFERPHGGLAASCALAGLSRLAVWWIKLGIRPQRIQAGHPEQNGRHERIHRTLEEHTATPPQPEARSQQRAFHHFCFEYNEVRPHEALGMQTPASLYRPSPRAFQERLPEPEYGTAMKVRRVFPHGQFCWNYNDVFLSKVLGEPSLNGVFVKK